MKDPQTVEIRSPPRLARTSLIHWPQIEPTVKRYQHPVPLSRVLADHHAALAAEPIEQGGLMNAGR